MTTSRKKRPFARTGIVALLTVALCAAFVPSVVAAALEGTTVADAVSPAAGAVSTAEYEKGEVVYATLGVNGEVSAYVVNRFDVTKAGTVVDYGGYSSVQSLTGGVSLARSGDKVVFEAEEGTVFYQGNIEAAQLPWNIEVNYELDGQPVGAADLAGATGELAIAVKTSRNDAADPAFFESYMLQITFTLPGGAVRDVAAEGATLASSGEDRTVAFTALPGRDGDFRLTAAVEDFHMASAQIAALPYTSVVEMPSTDGMVDGMSQLTSAVSQLSQGASQLSAGGAGLAAASVQMSDALTRISASLPQLTDEQMAQLKEMPAVFEGIADAIDAILGNAPDVDPSYAEAIARLSELAASLPSISEADLAQLEALVGEQGTASEQEALRQLVEALRVAQDMGSAAGGLEGAGEALARFNELHEKLAQAALSLHAAAENLQSLIDSGRFDQIIAQVETLPDTLSLYFKGVAQYVGGVDVLAAGLGQLNGATINLPATMRAEIEKMMADYEFPEFEPRSFVSSDNSSVTEVQFVVSTEAIEAPKVVEPEIDEPEQTMWDRFLALFAG